MKKIINILYLGNKLAIHGKNPTPVDTLSLQLGSFLEVVSASHKRNKILRLLDMLKHIWQYRHTTDFIIIDTYSTSNFYYALLCAQLARALKIKYIPFLHGGELPKRLQRNPCLSKLIFAHAHMNVTPSHYLEEKFGEAGYRVKYIPNNIPLAHYTFKLRENASPKLLYVRALRDPYNPLMAIRVFAAVRNKLGVGELCMVGPADPAMLVKIKTLAWKMGVIQHVTFTGRLSKPEWITLSSGYDIFINTTNADNMPVSIIEAMALGFPIVSTNAGGLPYLIENGQDGLLVEIGDAEAMADKIAEIIRNPDLSAKLSQNARNKAQTFDWEIVKELWKDLLGKVQEY